ncbi:MAG: YbhB/YbcL family Raf kinase inhibitor-like protein [Bdellovibrionales bacterium]
MKATFLVLALVCLNAQAKSFKLTSPDLKPGGVMGEAQVFNSFGCTGQNISPKLEWKNPPKDTKSFAVTVYDPDAPTGSGWWHWTVFNIPATTFSLESGASSDPAKMPPGSGQGRTDFGKPGYGGACPPVGDKAHRYIFTVYALKAEKLELDAEASGAMVGYFLKQNAIGKDSITVKYGRKK